MPTPAHPIPTACPHCGQPGLIPPAFMGRGIQCSRCGQNFVVGAQFQLAEEANRDPLDFNAPTPSPFAAGYDDDDGPISRPRRLDSGKNKFLAGLLAFFLGHMGIHKFYLDRPGSGVTMLVLDIVGVVLLPFGLIIVLGLAIWAFVDALVIWTSSEDSFHRAYVRRR